jgi:basic membrane lipoprotein Med (substrate-binding protein (PBP1-ABC) superfamily)
MNARRPRGFKTTALCLLVASCVLAVTVGGADRAAAQAPYVIGIVHLGSIRDGGYNQAHAEGIRVMQKNLPNVRVLQAENVSDADAERVIEGMARRGAKLIFAASFGFQDPAFNVARRFPDVKFEHPGGFRLAPNFGTYWASTQEAFYLVGMAAASVTKTNKLGFISALPISFFLANINAFHLGARSVNPQIETRVVFTGTFLDPGKEATAANALLDQGVDVMGMIVDSPITITQIVERRGAFTVGYHFVGLQKFSPKGWVSGVAFTWGGLYTRIAQRAVDGNWKSERKFYGVDCDCLAVAPFGPAVPARTVRAVTAAKQAIINGQLQIFQGPIRDNRGVVRVEAGRALTGDEYGRIDWLAEGVVGQPR